MPFPAAITPAILDAVVGHIAPHFLATTGNDLSAACDTASNLLAAYNVETEEELRLAGEIVSFSFHALETLSEAAAPDLPMADKLRLRGSAISLSREGNKAQRKLDQLKRARLTTDPQPETRAPAENNPATDQALGLIEFAKEALQASSKKGGAQAWTKNREQRRAAERITENLKRNQAEQARREAKLAAGNRMTQGAAPSA